MLPTCVGESSRLGCREVVAAEGRRRSIQRHKIVPDPVRECVIGLLDPSVRNDAIEGAHRAGRKPNRRGAPFGLGGLFPPPPRAGKRMLSTISSTMSGGKITNDVKRSTPAARVPSVLHVQCS